MCIKYQNTFNKLAKKLSEKFPHIELIQYGGTYRSVCVFRDNVYGEFQGRYCSVYSGQTKHKLRIKDPTYSLSEAEAKLKLKFSYLSIFCYKGAKDPKSIFVDEQYGFFFGCYNDVMQRKKNHPERGKQKIIEGASERGFKSIETIKKKYNVSSPSLIPEVRQKQIKTYLDKTGFKTPLHDPEVRSKVFTSKIKNGNVRKIKGFLIQELCSKTKANISECNRLYREFGEDVAFNYACQYKPRKNILEQTIQTFLNLLATSYVKDKKLKNTFFKPDFYLPDYSLVIECDGVRWHSELFKSALYHKNKKDIYSNLNLCSFFFRENEIHGKLNVVKNLIRSQLQNFDISNTTTSLVKCSDLDFLIVQQFYQNFSLDSNICLNYKNHFIFKQNNVIYASICFSIKKNLIHFKLTSSTRNINYYLDTFISYINQNYGNNYIIQVILDQRLENVWNKSFFEKGFIKHREYIGWNFIHLTKIAVINKKDIKKFTSKHVSKLFDCGHYILRYNNYRKGI